MYITDQSPGNVNTSENFPALIVGRCGAYGGLTATKNGSATFGYTKGVTNGSSGILNTGDGAIAHGYASATVAGSGVPGSKCHVNASADGAFAGGWAAAYQYVAYGYSPTQSYAYINASGKGSFAHGYITTSSFENLYGNTITSGGKGAWAGGYSNVAFNGIISATGNGSFVFGAIDGDHDITATGKGAIAFGHANGAGTGNINATASGAFAHGYVTGSTHCIASAAGAVQFGAGTNATTNSLQVGTTTDGVLLRPDTISVTAQHDILIAADNEALQLGDVADAWIYYNGTDLVLQPAYVGSGGVKILSTDETDYILIKHDNANAYFFIDGGSFYFASIEAANADTNMYVIGSADTGSGMIHTERFMMTDTNSGSVVTDMAEMVYNETSETIDFNFL